MNKEMLKGLIDLIDEKDTDTIFRLLIRFVSEDIPLPDEIEAILLSDKDIRVNGTITHDMLNWD